MNKKFSILGFPALELPPNALWDIEKFNMDYILTAAMLVTEELMLTTLEAQLNGIITIFNLDTFSMQHVKQCTPKRIKLSLDIFQGSFPLRLKGLHVVNEPSIFDTVVSAARPFMSQKFKEREGVDLQIIALQFYGRNYAKLHELIPPSGLTEQLGGNLNGDEAYDKNFIEKLFLRNSYYQELLEYGYGNWESDNEDTYM